MCQNDKKTENNKRHYNNWISSTNTLKIIIQDCDGYWWPYLLNLNRHSLQNEQLEQDIPIRIIYNFLTLMAYQHVNNMHSISKHNFTINICHTKTYVGKYRSNKVYRCIKDQYRWNVSIYFEY